MKTLGNPFTPSAFEVVGNLMKWVGITGIFSLVALLVMLFVLRWPKVAIGIAVFIGLVIGYVHFVGGPIQVFGKNMEPTYQNNKVYYLDKLTYRLVSPKRGDVVEYHPDEYHTDIVRIIGLPGETVIINNGSLTVNGRLLSEPYAYWDDTSISQTYILDADSYLGLMDHRVKYPYTPIMRRDAIKGKFL